MNIVHLAVNPLAGVPIKLANMINEHTEHTARVISVNGAYGLRTFDHDLLFDKSEKTIAQVNDLLTQADVIHVHNFFKDIQAKLKPVNLKRHLKRSRVCTQFHQVAELTSDELNIPIAEIARIVGTRILAIANQQALTYPTATVVPIVIPLQDEKHCMLPRKESEDDGIIRIVYAPSVTRLRGTPPLYQKYFDKGYGETRAILERIQATFGDRVKCNIIRGKPHRDCLHIKQRADIAIDEVKTGSYHTSTLETLSQGVVTIVNPERGVKNIVQRLTGSNTVPWQVANLDNLFSVLSALIEDATILRAQQQASRLWMEQYWNDEQWAPWFVKNVYSKL